VSAQIEQKEWIGNKVQVRLLEPDEYARLIPFFLNNEASMPSAAGSQVAVAEDQNGDIVGFFVLQLVAHAEPIWVAEDYRQQGVAKLMIDEINRIADHFGMAYYATPNDEQAAQLYIENSMQELPVRVFWRRPDK